MTTDEWVQLLRWYQKILHNIDRTVIINLKLSDVQTWNNNIYQEYGENYKKQLLIIKMKYGIVPRL